MVKQMEETVLEKKKVSLWVEKPEKGEENNLE